MRRLLPLVLCAGLGAGLAACADEAPVTTATLARPSTVPAAAAPTALPAPTGLPATTVPPTTLPPTTPAPTTVPTTVPTTPAPTTIPKVVPGRVVLVGDSVMAALDPNYTDAAREVLGAAGWKVDIDAAVNRSTIQGGSVVAGLHPGAGDTVVLMLGHNDAGSTKVFGPRVETVLAQLAGVQRVYWLTMREPRYAEANAVLAAAQATHPNLHLIPWAASIQPGWTAKDGLHLNGSGRHRHGPAHPASHQLTARRPRSPAGAGSGARGGAGVPEPAPPARGCPVGVSREAAPSGRTSWRPVGGGRSARGGASG